jgi:hypothetical protein
MGDSRRLLGALVAALVLAAAPAGATGLDSPAVLSHGFANAVTGGRTLGWEFTAEDDLTVTALGVLQWATAFHAESDGLVDAHDVGIWTPGGTLLVSATVPAGASALLEDGFRFAPLASPFALTRGQSYVIGAVFPTRSDRFDGEFAPPALDPRVSIVAGSLDDEPFIAGLAFPNASFASFSAYVLDANFLIAAPVESPPPPPAGIPEPSPAALLALALLALTAKPRR